MTEAQHSYLKDLVKESSFTQQQLSEASGVPAGTIARVLSGHTADPSFETVSRLTIALGGSLDALCGKVPEEVVASNVITTNITEIEVKPDTIAHIRSAYTHAYDSIQKQHEIELARVKKYLQIKDRWLAAMFAYCVLITIVCIFKL